MASLPPGYDWFPPSKWEQDDILSRPIRLPPSRPSGEGTYDLGFMAIDSDTGRSSRTQMRLQTRLLLWPTSKCPHNRQQRRRSQGTQSDYEQALAQAEKQQCEQAAESWRQARYHVWRDISWREKTSLEHDEAHTVDLLREQRRGMREQPKKSRHSLSQALRPPTAPHACGIQDLGSRPRSDAESLFLNKATVFSGDNSLKSFFGWIGDDLLANKALRPLQMT